MTAKSTTQQTTQQKPPGENNPDGKQKPKKVPAIRVTAKTDKFRRAGFEFTREPRTIPVTELTEEKYHILKDESMLVVEEIDVE